MTDTITRAYGWRPDRPDHRDLHLHEQVGLPLVHHLPPRIDLRVGADLGWPVYDQGQLGSCTANAIAGALRFEALKQGHGDIEPSRLWIYYEERAREGNVREDTGAEIRDGLKVVAQQGWPAEAEWPYDIARFADAPPAAVNADAAKDRVTRYMRVNVSATSLKQALAAGYPVVVGFMVFPGIESDEAATTGVIPTPRRGETSIGGHAVLAVGYDDSKGLFTIRNSWAEAWGDQGYGYLGYDYLGNRRYAQDWWAIEAEVIGLGIPLSTSASSTAGSPAAINIGNSETTTS